jgi:hypothetical protein
MVRKDEDGEALEIWNTHQSLGALAFWLPVHSDLALDNARADSTGQQVCPFHSRWSAKTRSIPCCLTKELRTKKGGLAATRRTHDRHQPA